VKNPLRLTLLCLSWQSGESKLPDTQAELYQQFVDDFYKWKKDEFATNSNQRQQLNIKLGELAREAIDKEATRFRLREDFVNSVFKEEKDKVLLKLALNHGWLNCVGVDTNRKPVYAFFHASFQEYFAAKAIDDWHFFLNHVPKNPSQGTYRIFEPQWKQTILLWLGREEENLKQQKQQFINALVNFKDGCGKWNRKDVVKGFYEYRAYFLAAAGITEFKDCSKADDIVDQIVKWTIYNYLSSITWEARLALQQTDRTKAIAALVELLQSKNVENYILKEAAWTLGKIDPGNEIAIAALVQLLQSTTVDDSTRREAAESLGHIDRGNEIAIAALVQLLQSTTVDDSTRREAAESLGHIGKGNEKAIAALVQLLQSNHVNYNIRSAAAHSLKGINPGNEIAIATLVQVLQSSTVSDYTRSEAAWKLRTIGTGNEIAIATLEQLLQSTTVDDSTRQTVAKSLGKIDPGNKIAITALVQLLQSTTVDDSTRWQAAESLGKIDPGNEIAIAALEQLLQSNHVDNDTRQRVAESLGKIDPGNKIAITALVQLLQSKNVKNYTRWQAAESLGEIDPANEIAIIAS
jgi:hypothetical protein